MCAGCMGTADFLLTGGVLGAASLKVAGRRLVPGWRDRGRGKVTDAEADAFITRLQRSAEGAEEADRSPARQAAPVDSPRGPTGEGAAQPQPAPSTSTEPVSPDGAPVPV